MISYEVKDSAGRVWHFIW